MPSSSGVTLIVSWFGVLDALPVAVRDAQGQRAAGVGARVGVGVAQVLHQRFDGVRRGRRAGEVDAQGSAAVGAAGERADGVARVAHHVARDADRPFADDAQLVFAGSATGEVQVEPAVEASSPSRCR